MTLKTLELSFLGGVNGLVLFHFFLNKESYSKALVSTASQNWMPSLSGVNLHLALDGKSCSSTVIYSPGT